MSFESESSKVVGGEIKYRLHTGLPWCLGGGMVIGWILDGGEGSAAMTVL